MSAGSHSAKKFLNEKRKLRSIVDPDYKSAEFKEPEPKKSKHSNEVIKIVNREFDLEISKKEVQATEIDDKIAKTKLLLQKLRFAIVTNYYNKDSVAESNSDVLQSIKTLNGNLEDVEKHGPQIGIHPAIRALSRKYHNPGKSPKQQIKEPDKMTILNSSAKNNSLLQESTNSLEICKKSQISSLNSARCSNQTKHLIVVGNTSKYINLEDPSDSSTHKWLIYVQSKTSIPIENFVSKVRFYLHPSYSPNDIVEIV